MSDSVRPHRRKPTRLPRPWDSPGKNTGVGCHFLLQRMKVKSESEFTQSCLTLRDPMDCSLPGSSIHGIFQARVLKWGAIAVSVLTMAYHNLPPLILSIIKWWFFNIRKFGGSLLCSNRLSWKLHIILMGWLRVYNMYPWLISTYIKLVILPFPEQARILKQVSSLYHLPLLCFLLSNIFHLRFCFKYKKTLFLLL